MENISHHNNQLKNSGRVWSGFIIIIIGFAFLLNNIGLDIPRWIFSWSNFLILLGVFIGVRRNFKGIGWLVLILVGAYNTLIRIPGLDIELSKYALGFGLVIVGDAATMHLVPIESLLAGASICDEIVANPVYLAHVVSEFRDP